MEINKIHQGNALELLKQLPDNFIDMGITSPPYWRQRDYKSEPSIWNEKENCKHQWNFQERFLHRGTINTPTVHSALNRGGLETEWKTKDAFCLKCGAWLGQLGLEPSFEMYITNLCTIFNQVERVLKKEGSFWLNIGDTYGGSGGDRGKTGEFEKSLLGIPFRIATAMIDKGWRLRNTIIWHKGSCMPQSVIDRFTNDFEYLFFFLKWFSPQGDT